MKFDFYNFARVPKTQASPYFVASRPVDCSRTRVQRYRQRYTFCAAELFKGLMVPLGGAKAPVTL